MNQENIFFKKTVLSEKRWKEDNPYVQLESLNDEDSIQKIIEIKYQGTIYKTGLEDEEINLALVPDSPHQLPFERLFFNKKCFWKKNWQRFL